MRHVMFVAILSVVSTPIAALQDQLTPRGGSPSVQAEMIQTLNTVRHKATNLYRKVENRIYVGVREFLD